MICSEDINKLKTDIQDKIGQRIIVKGSLGRSKAFMKEATIEGAYPSLFIVKYNEGQRNVTYSYTDILTRIVEVDVYDGESYSPIIPPPPPKRKRLKKKGFTETDDFFGQLESIGLDNYSSLEEFPTLL